MDLMPRNDEEFSLAIEYVTGTKSGRNDAPVFEPRFVELVGKELKLPKGAESQRFKDVLEMLKDFAARKVVKRPLSIAVFGPPGSGKSRGMKLLLKEIGGCRPVVEVNLSQVDDGAKLAETVGKEITEANDEQIAEAKNQDIEENSPDSPNARRSCSFLMSSTRFVVRNRSGGSAGSYRPCRTARSCTRTSRYSSGNASLSLQAVLRKRSPSSRHERDRMKRPFESERFRISSAVCAGSLILAV
jgi:hypothetical protein